MLAFLFIIYESYLPRSKHVSIKSSCRAPRAAVSPNLRPHTFRQNPSSPLFRSIFPLRFDPSFLLLPFLCTLTEPLGSVCSAAWLIYLSYQGKSSHTRGKKGVKKWRNEKTVSGATPRPSRETGSRRARLSVKTVQLKLWWNSKESTRMGNLSPSRSPSGSSVSTQCYIFPSSSVSL